MCHKDGIVVALAEGGLPGEVRGCGRIANTPAALQRLVRKLGHQGVELRFCYEAGPCGFGIQRRLSAAGHDCIVVAPSLIPKQPGDRIKTDRRDASSLAKPHRAGELTAVWVPDAGHEAIRDLVRARLDAVRELRRARQQLSGFLGRYLGARLEFAVYRASIQVFDPTSLTATFEKKRCSGSPLRVPR
jgi:transposase